MSACSRPVTAEASAMMIIARNCFIQQKGFNRKNTDLVRHFKMFHSILFIFPGRFLAEKELLVITAKVYDDFLQDDIRILGPKLQGM